MSIFPTWINICEFGLYDSFPAESVAVDCCEFPRSHKVFVHLENVLKDMER